MVAIQLLCQYTVCDVTFIISDIVNCSSGFVFAVSDVLQMMGRAGRPQFDDQGVAVILVHDVKKHFYKKFIYEPFPVESRSE